MSEIQLNNFYSGGYFLLRADKLDWSALKENPLLPDKLVSLSTHNCPCRVRVPWATVGNEQSLSGIPEHKLADYMSWEHSADLDRLSMFYSTDAARRFVKRFELATDDLYLIGAGLPVELEEKYWREPPPDGKTDGIEKRIEQHLPLEEGGNALGFEPVTFEYNDFGCSWLCTDLHRDMHEVFGIKPNQYGLIETYEAAKKVNDWIAEDQRSGGKHTEPVAYDFWLLVAYPLTI